ncbi:hypothetical protein [Pollutibacter soli]|uniref:hypothetical protein n=1 Tax=Pollutibacter soli TaxID=3034157 RepID=UPI003013BD14
MRWLLLIGLFFSLDITAQENSESAQVFLESEAGNNDVDEIETEDRQTIAEWYARYKININHTSAFFLTKEFSIPTDAALQLESYIRLVGPLIDVLELQAVPGWTPELVKSILPYITIEEPIPLPHLFRRYLQQGQHMMQLRLGMTGEKSNGFQNREPLARNYEGNRLKAMFRYNFSAGQFLRWGFAAEKDAGESLFRNGRSVDFSSFYFQMSGVGILRTVLLGDFHINMGQGLIHWQSSAMRKSAETIVTIRQGSDVRMHSGTGEQQFHRGAALNFQLKKWKLLVFGAFDQWDANGGDTTRNEKKIFSSIQVSGLHRTATEIADKNALNVVSAGGAVTYRSVKIELGLNAIGYRFNGILEKERQPANLYALNGGNWFNASLDYKYSFRSWYFFGETAIDRRFSPAVSGGIIGSIHPKIDLTIMYRWISPAYQALQANAFTEQSTPSNERGLYCGVRININRAFKVSAYVDLFSFPWLRSGINEPSRGNSVLLQGLWTPDKRNEVLFRFQEETKMENLSSGAGVLKPVEAVTRKILRFQQRWIPDRQLEFSFRMDMVWILKSGQNHENGFLFYGDALFKPEKSPFSAALRVARFSTDGWASRVYSSERDVRNYHTITPLYGEGWRQYFLVNYKLSRYILVSVKGMFTYYLDKQTIGSGPDLINRPYRTDYRLQFLVFF